MRKIAVALIIVMMTGMTTFADPTADSETVKSIQTALNAAGYDCGEPDGIVGQKTMDALSQYCSEKGITWDGTITDELVVSLGGGEDETEDAATQYDDKLQQICANLTFSTTEGDLLSWIEQYGLEYSAQKWNGTPKELTYKIAYEEGVTAQKYADSGDHIEVSFNADDGTFLLAEYCPSSGNRSALYYSYGTFWDFREKQPGNRWSGYYYNDRKDYNKTGIEMVYTNGNSVKTSYHACKDADDALRQVG